MYSLLAVMLLAGIVTSCDALLEVEDPGSITEDQVQDPKMETLIINGVYASFHTAFNSLHYWAAAFSDEIYIDHTTVSIREFVRFDFNNGNQNNLNLYNLLHKSRVIAEDAVERVTEFHGGTAGNLNIAFAQVYAGYSNIFLGELYCESAINNGPKITSNDHLTRAITQLQEAIVIANAATTEPDRKAHLINLANLGIARASLQMGNMSQAIQHANLVPSGFEAWAYYGVTSGSNTWGGQWLATNKSSGVAERFQNLNDPRVVHTTQTFPGLQNYPLRLPYDPLEYQGYNANNPQPIGDATNVRFGSHLEARYIIAEASGATPATLAFVNERRAVGLQDPVDLTGADLMAELRTQRSRDFFLTGRRHADLRRYIALYGIDEFPTGVYPVTGGNEFYGNVRCFLLPLNEIDANPNI